jgi:hypothetical protein
VTRNGPGRRSASPLPSPAYPQDEGPKRGTLIAPTQRRTVAAGGATAGAADWRGTRGVGSLLPGLAQEGRGRIDARYLLAAPPPRRRLVQGPQAVGVVSVGKSQAEAAKTYIARQGGHHKAQDFRSVLPRLLRARGFAFNERDALDRGMRMESSYAPPVQGRQTTIARRVALRFTRGYRPRPPPGRRVRDRDVRSGPSRRFTVRPAGGR